MIIHVIARDVGESRCSHIDPVETELIEPVARGFQRQMLDAFLLQPRELGMQRDRIGRRVRELHVPGRRIDAEVPRLAALRPCERPDLPQERGDRRLAVGAGDGGDAVRLRAVEFRRHLREAQSADSCRR